MVSSGVVNSDLNSINKNFINYNKTISSINNSVWEGMSKDNLVAKSEEFVSEYKPPINSQMSDFAAAVDLNKEYEKLKEDSESAKKSLTRVSESGNENLINELKTKIASFEIKMNSFKKEIESLLENIKSQVLESATSIMYGNLDINAIVESIDKDELRKLGDNENLASFYEEGYIQNIMDDIKNSKYLSGREKAVKSALTLIQLAADKGVKLDYDFGGGHVSGSVTTNMVLSGVDCSSFASFIINQGTSHDVISMDTGCLANKYSKYTTDYSNAKPGDLLNVHSSKGKHVEIIIENHPEEGYFITAEARSSDSGIELNRTSYNECKSCGQNVYNMDDVYDK